MKILKNEKISPYRVDPLDNVFVHYEGLQVQIAHPIINCTINRIVVFETDDGTKKAVLWRETNGLS